MNFACGLSGFFFFFSSTGNLQVKHPWKAFAGLALAALILPAAAPAEKADVRRQVEQPVQEAIQIRRDTHKAETQWRTERERLTAVYDQLQREQADRKSVV